jgi:hypothetical protein
MLLKDLDGFSLPIEKPSIGIHLIPGIMGGEDEDHFIEWISSLGLNVYFLPVTHYNIDFTYLNTLRSRVDGSKIVPILKAQEVFTIIGKFDYFISSSLHGAIFSYVHNVPFLVLDRSEDRKMKFFMEDRDLGRYLFADFHELKCAFDSLMKDRPNYSEKTSEDFKILNAHIKDLEIVLEEARTISRVSARNEREEDEDLALQLNFQVHNLQLLTIQLNAEIDKLQNHVKNLEELVQYREAEIQAIHESISWRILRIYEKLLGGILPRGTKRRRYYERVFQGHRATTIL